MISGPASSGKRRPKRSIMYPVGTVASTPPTIGASTIRAAAATFTWNSSLAMKRLHRHRKPASDAEKQRGDQQ